MASVAVIGGGAAGMMAALTAARGGQDVCLLEKNEKLGKKIYITGKGRCNFTNACDFAVFINHIVSNPRFMYSSGRAFGPEDMIRFLEESGCRTKVERGNRAFPASDHASDVTRALEREMKQAGVRIRLETEVLSVCPVSQADGSSRFELTLRERNNRRPFVLSADAVIVCTGGLSYPSTGSTGDGYRFASEAGMRVTDCVPALVPLTVLEQDHAELQGVSLKNVSLKVLRRSPGETAEASGKKSSAAVWESEPGEILFTHFGLSGPLILTASSLISSGLSKGSGYELSIDLKPGLTEEMLDQRLLRDFEGAQNRQIRHALEGLLISSLREMVLIRAGIQPDVRVRDITKKDRHRLTEVIKHLKYTVTGTRGFAEAVITQGGVSTLDVDPKTMESRTCPGLYFAGEVLDVDAYTGGFNLQIAWSTGHAAGLSVSGGAY